MRCAACRRTSSQLAIVRGAGSATAVAGALAWACGECGDAGVAATVTARDVGTASTTGALPPDEKQPAASSVRPMTAPRRPHSMQCTIDLLRQVFRNAVDAHQVRDARIADAAHAAEALQQPRPLLRADAGDVLEAARAGPHARAACPHAGDREAVRLVTDLRNEHQRRRILAKSDLRAAIGEDHLLETDLAALALLDAD